MPPFAGNSGNQGNRPATFSIDRDHPNIASLDGLWRFHPGDDPLWASPDFDDSQWPLIRSDRSWTEQGYADTFGYAWYRFKFEVEDGAKPVSLLLTEIISGYQVYVNGTSIGGAGASTFERDPVFGALPTEFPLPLSGKGPQTIQIALRVWTYKPIAVWYGAGAFGRRNEAGDPAYLTLQLHRIQDARALRFMNEFGFGLLSLVAGLTILGLFLFHPADREYLWFAILLLSQAIGTVFHVSMNLGSLPFPLYHLLNLASGAVSIIASLAFFSMVLHRRRSRLWWMTCITAAASPLTAALIYFQWTSVGVSIAIGVFCLLPAEVWIIATLFAGAFKKDVSARLLLAPAVLSYGMALISDVSRIAWQLTGNQHLLFDGVPLTSHPFPLTLADLISYIFIFALLVFLVRRFSLARQEETRLSTEMEAARSIQSLLVPSAATSSTTRFAVESVYLPANEVGGDFFQILPEPGDGSLMVVAGDVSGKGLPAGMLVALLVGAIRATAETTTEPLAMLEALNRRLVGRGDAKATCLALRIEADGSATLANAGHLPPYLNGHPVEMEGALPLGVIEDAEFSVMRFELNEQDRLVLMSDGIAEATDASGKLFGFERVNELLSTAKSAAEVASAAQKFGQEDDISVISVTLMTALTPALA
jgi:hypothetical protein